MQDPNPGFDISQGGQGAVPAGTAQFEAAALEATCAFMAAMAVRGFSPPDDFGPLVAQMRQSAQRFMLGIRPEASEARQAHDAASARSLVDRCR